MSRAIERHVAHGPVVIIGSDAPTLPRAYLHQALDELMAHEVVIGPSEDGGYYLIGATKPLPELFVDVHWSTAEVLPTTLQRLGGRSSVVLPPWHDVDEAADLLRLRAELAALPSTVATATRRVLGSMPVGEG
jgi:glycosyltransferase A (GT-A) superfamily protein (DUF2064 family)